jgi:hypothetical protein
MGISTATLAYIAVGASVAGAGVAAYGSIEASEAQAASAKYNSEIATQNAVLAQRNATSAAQAGEQQVAVQQQKTRSEVGAIEANQAASNINVDSGSAVDVRSSAAELGELNALTVRSNAAKQAYGYETEAVGYKEQAALDTSAAEQDITAGEIGASTSLLGGLSSASTNWLNFAGSTGLNPGGPSTWSSQGSPNISAELAAGGFGGQGY